GRLLTAGEPLVPPRAPPCEPPRSARPWLSRRLVSWSDRCLSVSSLPPGGARLRRRLAPVSDGLPLSGLKCSACGRRYRSGHRWTCSTGRRLRKMIHKLRHRVAREESGFTLIELL